VTFMTRILVAGTGGSTAFALFLQNSTIVRFR